MIWSVSAAAAGGGVAAQPGGCTAGSSRSPSQARAGIGRQRQRVGISDAGAPGPYPHIHVDEEGVVAPALVAVEAQRPHAAGLIAAQRGRGDAPRRQRRRGGTAPPPAHSVPTARACSPARSPAAPAGWRGPHRRVTGASSASAACVPLASRTRPRASSPRPAATRRAAAPAELRRRPRAGPGVTPAAARAAVAAARRPRRGRAHALHRADAARHRRDRRGGEETIWPSAPCPGQRRRRVIQPIPRAPAVGSVIAARAMRVAASQSVSTAAAASDSRHRTMIPSSEMHAPTRAPRGHRGRAVLIHPAGHGIRA